MGNAGVRDQKRLSWRFFSKPGNAYTFWLLQHKGVPAAYAVTSIKAGDLRTGYIIDILFRPEGGILESLLNRVIQQMVLDKIDVVECLAVGNSPLVGLAARGMGSSRNPRDSR